jgi:hypothetical protein
VAAMPELTLEEWATGAAVFTAALGLVLLGMFLFRRVCDSAREWLEMPADDRREWEQCRTLREVAVCTARWLTGELRGQPGYHGPVDVDEDLHPGMTQVLIACNEAGFLTTGSQAGYVWISPDGDSWHQHAAVDGLVDFETLGRLADAASGAQVFVYTTGAGKTVTYRNGVAFTGFGRRRRDLGDDWTGYGMCHPSAVAELKDAIPVVVFDPVPGRNDQLWKVLAAFAATSEAGVTR